jgi:hypothetical protein
MNRWITTIVLCAAVLGGCAKDGAKPESMSPTRAAMPPEAPPSGSLGAQTMTATATVEKVDLKARKVTLKDEDGKTLTVVAGPEVRNLEQVKKGDVLRLTYQESLAYQVSKAGEAKPGVGASTDVSRAPLGAKPAGSITDTVTVRMTIAGIDKKNSTVTLRDPDNVESVVKVRDPSKLDAVAVGDVVDITYTEALAIAVEKAAKK